VVDKEGLDFIHAAATRFDGRERSNGRRRNIIDVVVFFEEDQDKRQQQVLLLFILVECCSSPKVSCNGNEAFVAKLL
jgi:hypothetical protein